MYGLVHCFDAGQRELKINQKRIHKVIIESLSDKTESSELLFPSPPVNPPPWPSLCIGYCFFLSGVELKMAEELADMIVE